MKIYEYATEANAFEERKKKKRYAVNFNAKMTRVSDLRSLTELTLNDCEFFDRVDADMFPNLVSAKIFAKNITSVIHDGLLELSLYCTESVTRISCAKLTRLRLMESDFNGTLKCPMLKSFQSREARLTLPFEDLLAMIETVTYFERCEISVSDIPKRYGRIALSAPNVAAVTLHPIIESTNVILFFPNASVAVLTGNASGLRSVSKRKVNHVVLANRFEEKALAFVFKTLRRFTSLISLRCVDGNVSEISHRTISTLILERNYSPIAPVIVRNCSALKEVRLVSCTIDAYVNAPALARYLNL